MPHLKIEYSDGLSDDAVHRLCKAVHSVMLGSEIFPTAGIRVRAYKADAAIVADGLPENDFAALTLSVGAGRSTDKLQQAGTAIFAAAQAALADRLAEPHFALSLEIRQIEPDLSWKDTPIHARLSERKKD